MEAIYKEVLIPLLTALIGAAGAVFGGYVSRYGMSFYKPADKIRCRGTAKALQLVRPDDSLTRFEDLDWEQDLDEVRLSLHTRYSRISAHYTMRHKSQVRMRGQLDGVGRFTHGRAYFHYQIVDKDRAQELTGVMELSISQWGDIKGHYLAKSYAKEATSVVGSIRLVRV